MDIDNFEKLVKTRQSCRSFDGTGVDRAELERVLEIARLSPSACNSQPWSFIVLSGESAKAATEFLQPLGGNKFTSDCPSFIVIAEEKSNLAERLGERFLGQDFVALDIGIATAHIVLAAESCGLATCILGAFRAEKLRQHLGITKNVRIVVGIGHATKDYAIREKKRKSDGVVEFRN